MNVQDQIERYIAEQPAAKCDGMQALHEAILGLSPNCRTWFLDGRNEDNKIVSNPNIGYGVQTIEYANGKTREFYQVGLSANTTGISVYIMGLEDKKYLPQTYGDRLGNASITGYCIKFKTIADIDMTVLREAIGQALNP